MNYMRHTWRHQTFVGDRGWQRRRLGKNMTPYWSIRRDSLRLQYQYASSKNTSDIALALDALEDLFDQRADACCLMM
jgi:hypothetical protein